MQGHIGLNEVAIGISVPLYWGQLMARVIGEKQAEHLCKNAALLSPPEALKVSALATPASSPARCIEEGLLDVINELKCNDSYIYSLVLVK